MPACLAFAEPSPYSQYRFIIGFEKSHLFSKKAVRFCRNKNMYRLNSLVALDLFLYQLGSWSPTKRHPDCGSYLFIFYWNPSLNTWIYGVFWIGPLKPSSNGWMCLWFYRCMSMLVLNKLSNCLVPDSLWTTTCGRSCIDWCVCVCMESEKEGSNEELKLTKFQMVLLSFLGLVVNMHTNGCK